VPESAIASHFAKSSNTLSNLPTQRPLDGVISLQKASETAQFVLVQLLGFLRRINFGGYANLTCDRRPYTIQILEGIKDLFVVWKVNTEKTRHSSPLLMVVKITSYISFDRLPGEWSR
jgi:hypothetical protein